MNQKYALKQIILILRSFVESGRQSTINRYLRYILVYIVRVSQEASSQQENGIVVRGNFEPTSLPNCVKAQNSSTFALEHLVTASVKQYPTRALGSGGRSPGAVAPRGTKSLLQIRDLWVQRDVTSYNPNAQALHYIEFQNIVSLFDM